MREATLVVWQVTLVVWEVTLVVWEVTLVVWEVTLVVWEVTLVMWEVTLVMWEVTLVMWEVTLVVWEVTLVMWEVTLAMRGTGILPVQARSLHHEFPHLIRKCYIDLFQQGKHIKMSEKITRITVKKLADNKVVEVLADGSTMLLKGETDWKKIKDMTDDGECGERGLGGEVNSILKLE